MARNIGATLSIKDGNFFASIKSASSAVDGFKNKLSGGVINLKSFGSAAEDIKSPLNSLKDSIKGVVATYATLSSLKGLGKLSDEMSMTKARLDMVNDGLQTSAELNNMIFKTAKDSRGQYKATADLVTSLSNNCGTVFESTRETVTFAEQLNKRFAIAGVSSEAASNAITQLSQGLAAGALRGDELNSVLEQAPNIARSIESYMGIAQGSIKGAAEQGLVTADVVKNAILSTAEETNAQFASMPQTWGSIWQSIKTTALQASDGILTAVNDVANGEAMQGLITKVTDGINSLASSGVLEGFINNMISGAESAINLISSIYTKVNDVANGEAMQGLITKVTDGINSLASSGVLEGFVNSMVSGAEAAVDLIGSIYTNWDKVKVVIGIVGGAILAYKGIIAGCTIAEKALNAAEIIGNGLKVAKKLAISGLINATVIYNSAMNSSLVTKTKSALLTAKETASLVIHKGAVIASTVATKALAAGQMLLNAAFVSTPIGWIVLGIAALVAAFVTLWNKCEGFRNFWINLWNGIKSVASSAWTTAKNATSTAFETLKSTVSEKLNNIKASYEEHGGGIKGIAAAAMTGIKEYYTLGYDYIDNLTGGKLTAIKDKFLSIWESVKNGVANIWNGIVNSVKGAINKVISAVNSMMSKAVGGINKLINGINSISSKVGIPSIPTISAPQISLLAQGGILTRATLFGFSGRSALVGGEAGAEAVLPLNTFWRQLEKFTLRREASGGVVNNNNIYVTVQSNGDDDETLANKVARRIIEKLENM